MATINETTKQVRFIVSCNKNITTENQLKALKHSEMTFHDETRGNKKTLLINFQSNAFFSCSQLSPMTTYLCFTRIWEHSVGDRMYSSTGSTPESSWEEGKSVIIAPFFFFTFTLLLLNITSSMYQFQSFIRLNTNFLFETERPDWGTSCFKLQYDASWSVDW